MEKPHTISESNSYYKIEPCNTFDNNLKQTKQNPNQKNISNTNNLKFSNLKKFENIIINDNSKYRVIPSIIEKKDLFINKNKTLLNIKDLISNKIKTMKVLSKDKCNKKQKNNYSSMLSVKYNDQLKDKCIITNQQIFIKNNYDNCEIVDFRSHKIDDARSKNEMQASDDNINEDRELAEIKNKFLGSPKLRNTTPLIDEEIQLKRLYLKNNYNKNLLNKNERNVDIKMKTSDNFFMNKNKRENFIKILSPDNDKKEEGQKHCKNRKMSKNNRLTEKEVKFINHKNNKSAGSLSQFNIKNFNPESQIYFKSEFFENLENLYPIYLKKDYYIQPSKKLNDTIKKPNIIGNSGSFPNRKNNNSILYKMRNSEVMTYHRNIYSSCDNNNRLSFNYMNPQIIDFFDFERELNNKKYSIDKHKCSRSFRNKDSLSNGENPNSFRSQIKNYNHMQNNNFSKDAVNLKSKLSNKDSNKGLKIKSMNRDLTCFSNIQINNNINERMDKPKNSNENNINNMISDKNINNTIKYNSLSNTFSDPSDNLIKSKNGINKNNQEENYYAMGKDTKIKNQMIKNSKNKEINVNEDYRSLDVNLNFSQISSEEIINNNPKNNALRKCASRNFENENTLIENKYDNKHNNIYNSNKYELSKNTNDFYFEETKSKNNQENEDSYQRNLLNKINLDEINNPLIIKKYEIRNLQEGNMLRLANGKSSYLPFQKTFNIEKIHFNFSNKSSIGSKYFTSNDNLSKNNFVPAKSDGFKNYNSHSKKLIILKK